ARDAELQRHGSGKGCARSFGALSRRRLRAVRHPRQRHIGRADPHARRRRHRRCAADVRLPATPRAAAPGRDAGRDRGGRALPALGALHRSPRRHPLRRFRLQHHRHAASHLAQGRNRGERERHRQGRGAVAWDSRLRAAQHGPLESAQAERGGEEAARGPPALRARTYSAPAASRCWSMRCCSASAFCFASKSSPVAWSTTFMERRTLPRSSKPRSFTLTLSPSLTTSVTFCTRRGASWLMCTRPSLAPKKFTKAPKSITLTTVPS